MMLLVTVLGCLLSGVAWKGWWGGRVVGTCFWVTSGGFGVPARLWGFGCAGPYATPGSAVCVV